MTGTTAAEPEANVDVLIVGAGQASLGTGHWLARRTALSFLIVDGADRIGESWRRRWDSLVLFTPRRFSSLPGLRMRGSGEYASKNETADYLAAYADRFRLPVRLRTRVLDLRPDGNGGFVAQTTTGRIRARHVVVATGPYTRPYLPDASADLDPLVPQLHSSAYRRPDDLPGRDVLVVGAGNSAAQLAVELAATRRVTVAAPGGMWFLPARILGVSLYWWIWLTGILNGRSSTPISRLVRARGDGIIGRELQALVAAGTVTMIEHRVVRADGRTVLLADGIQIDTDAVLWCTGFRPDYDWLRVPGALDDHGGPVHEGGRSPVPGLHWMGLPWQTRLNSGIIDGVDRDAQALVRGIVADTERHIPVWRPLPGNVAFAEPAPRTPSDSSQPHRDARTASTAGGPS